MTKLSSSKTNQARTKSPNNPQLIQALDQYERQLRRLTLEEVPFEVFQGSKTLDLSSWTLIITDRCLSRLVQKYNSSNLPLNSITLSGGDKVTDTGIQILSTGFPHISSLHLENLFQVTDKGLLTLVRSCQNIKSLSLSGCLGISGAGFAILGQYSQNLVSLKVSSCRQISTWSFMKIFESCRNLEEIDVSYCSLLTDQELKILSDHVISLKDINLKECRQISDIGISALCQGCQKLERLNLSRTDLVFRITDVSLLSIGENCRLLKSINLSGCEMISDAGISWLVSGSSDLEHVNLSNCAKVSNGGLRCLGEGCIKLKSIVLSNVKKVSDVGIRYLADNCPVLEYINSSGLYLLSDGFQRDFGFEGLQAIGKSKCSQTIRKLNLQGCFQISKIALRSISEMKGLESLTLSSCTNLTYEGMVQVAKSCKRLSLLSLASCGECITNEMLESMACHLISLRTLILTDCVKVGRRGLTGISTCTKLSHLDLAGCINISNDAILSLCSGNFNPGLRVLNLERCCRVSDTALTWITDGLKDVQADVYGDVTLHTLSLRGTKVSASALKSIREHFRYSTLKINDAYLGFLALSRPDDRKVINQYGKRAKSATIIQAMVRSHNDREIFQDARRKYCMIKVATKLGALVRGRIARRLATKIRHNKWLHRIMATKVQCFFRILQASKMLQKRKEDRWRLVAPYAAKKIQRVYRGMRDREIARMERKLHDALVLKRKKCCLFIQTFFRRIMAIQLKKQLMRERLEMKRVQKLSSTIIQSCWRRYIAFKTAELLRDSVQRQRQKEFLAGMKINYCCKRFLFVLFIEKKIMHRRNLNFMASKIQIWFRDRKELIKQKSLNRLFLEQKKNRSSIRIQSTWRRKEAYILLRKRRADFARLQKLKSEKAFILTNWWRYCLARHRIHQLRILRAQEIRELIRIQIWASTMIAACWRGFKGRKKAKAKLDSQKASWTQIWSEGHQTYYFYNEITGESRWRKPQDLLDLEEKPICNNCNFYEAQLECSDCCEFFCFTCWDAVHFGGRRKNHLFRSLYDYYGKRVDYQESEFPSKWPSEVEQDEKLGWQLRVTPYRTPICKDGDLSIYHDEDSNRVFYHDERDDKHAYG